MKKSDPALQLISKENRRGKFDLCKSTPKRTCSELPSPLSGVNKFSARAHRYTNGEFNSCLMVAPCGSTIIRFAKICKRIPNFLLISEPTDNEPSHSAFIVRNIIAQTMNAMRLYSSTMSFQSYRMTSFLFSERFLI